MTRRDDRLCRLSATGCTAQGRQRQATGDTARAAIEGQRCAGGGGDGSTVRRWSGQDARRGVYLHRPGVARSP
jgi:hypothetical protein